MDVFHNLDLTQRPLIIPLEQGAWPVPYHYQAFPVEPINTLNPFCIWSIFEAFIMIEMVEGLVALSTATLV